MISVVIITYNMGHLIVNALNSLKNQTRRDFEIIVVDNHSTDNTDSVISQFQDLEIKLYKIHNDGILSKSRNLGIEKSSGDWISFLDADDIWAENRIEKIYDQIDRCDNEVVAITHSSIIKDLLSGRTMVQTAKIKENLTKQLVLEKNQFVLTATTIKKEALISVGGFSENPDYRTVEDNELWIRLSQKGRFEYIDCPLSTVILHEGNYSKKADIQMNALHLMKTHYLNSFTLCSDDEKRNAFKKLYELESRCLQKNGFFKEAVLKIKEGKNNGYLTLKMCIIYCFCRLKISR